MNDGGVDGMWFGFVEIDVVITPVVGEVGTDEDDIAGLEAFDVIADELGAAALMKKDQFHFYVVVPAVIDERVPVFTYTEGVGGGVGDFEQFGFHGSKITEVRAAIGGRSIPRVGCCGFRARGSCRTGGR